MEIYDEDTLSPFELQRQKNIIKNYEFMIACGLPAKPLIYVKRQEVPLEERFKYVDESSDEDDQEWTSGTKKKVEKVEPVGNPWDIRTKVKNPTSFFKKKAKEEMKNAKKSKEKKESVVEKTKKQFIRGRPKLPLKVNDSNKSGNVDEKTSSVSVVEERSRRYPKRCARVNYEESVPDDDHYLFCDECANFYYGDCPIHGTLLPCGDNDNEGEGNVKNSVASLPDGLEIKESMISGAGLGVFATKTFTVGTTFGPYMGRKVRPDIPKDDIDTSYMWEIMKEGKILYYINGKDESFSNWMRYINCSRIEEEQNLIALQYHGEIYYRVYKEIDPSCELLVWYGEEYASELGIDLEEESEEKVVDVVVFKCKQCDISFSQPEDLKHHEKHCRKREKVQVLKTDTHQVAKTFECNVCGKVFNQSGSLNRHMVVHTGEKPFRCEICGKQFNHDNNLKKHMRIHTGEKPFKCETCGEQFTQYGHLKVHTRVHTGDKPFKCETCGKQFNHDNNLKKHIRIHTGEKPYKCETCGKQFTQYGHLKVHTRVHTGDKPFKCETCGKQFNHDNNLKKHMRIHTGEKPYKCETCGKQFSENGSLKRHMRVHTGEKPFKCETCGVRFTTNSNLEVHKRIHTGEKPFKCATCYEQFNQSNSLKVHIRVHTGEKPYKCDVCGAKFKQSSILKRHTRTHDMNC